MHSCQLRTVLSISLRGFKGSQFVIGFLDSCWRILSIQNPVGLTV